MLVVLDDNTTKTIGSTAELDVNLLSGEVTYDGKPVNYCFMENEMMNKDDLLRYITKIRGGKHEKHPV